MSVAQQVLPGHSAATLAIGAVGAHADARWKAVASAAVMRVMLARPTFTTDDVWDAIGGAAETHDNRAIGAVLKALKKCGLIVPTMDFRVSARAVNHGRPVRVWRAA